MNIFTSGAGTATRDSAAGAAIGPCMNGSDSSLQGPRITPVSCGMDCSEAFKGAPGSLGAGCTAQF